jgi:uncharacterized protein (AIM24 family)
MESKEAVEVEPGAMCFMTPGVSMITSLGENNLVAGTIAGLKRVAAGENFFINTFINLSDSPAYIGITAPNPLDKIVTLDLSEKGEMRCARDSYLCSLVR